MFNEIRRVFRRSMEAFRDELNSHQPEDQVAELLGSMRRELVAVRAAIPEYEEDLTRTRTELARERDGLALCERRATLAEKIGDEETVRVAGEFAAKHRQRISVLEQKAAAAEAELSLRRREADEMTKRYKEADANRFALLAQLRRSAAGGRMRDRLDGEEGPLSDFSRMEERVDQNAAYSDALEELSDLDDSPAPRRPSPAELDERLRELKRQMGRE